ncbi:MAG: hypothetical protein GXO87_05950 [Chlorobi bacterium]|nr:hypothetical protein [Chlorobiota bacterium]
MSKLTDNIATDLNSEVSLFQRVIIEIKDSLSAASENGSVEKALEKLCFLENRLPSVQKKISRIDGGENEYQWKYIIDLDGKIVSVSRGVR